jgi:hypothetical protein
VIVLILVRLAIGVHHGGLVSLTGEAVFLEVALLLAVSAGGVGVSHGGGGASLVAVVATIVVLIPSVANDTKLIELLI